MIRMWASRIEVNGDANQRRANVYVKKPETAEFPGLREKTVLSGPCRTPNRVGITQFMEMDELLQVIEVAL
jgi:hypothetical protein